MTKLVTIKEMAEKIESLKRQDQVVGLAHGCFDFIHFGHILHFKSAKKLCDILVVSLTSEEFISKGENRPFYNNKQRVEFLSEISSIDYLIINQDSDAVELLEKLKPSLYIKGQDYKNFEDDKTGKIKLEKQSVEKNNGKLVFTEDKKLSSSEILKKFNLS